MLTIEDKMDSLGVTIQELSKKLELNPSTISRFLSGKNELKFESLFRLIQILYVEEEQPEAFRFYFKRLRNKRNIQCSLEYFSSNRDFEDVKYLMERERNNSNNELKELLFIYDILYRVLYVKETINEVSKSFTTIPPFHSKDAKTLYRVIRLYSGMLLATPDFIYQGKDDALHSVEQLEDSFFKKSLMNRINELMIYAAVQVNNLDETRNYIQQMLENDTCPYFKGISHYYLSKTEALHSFENALDALRKARKFLKNLNSEDFLTKIDLDALPFLFLFHEKAEVSDINFVFADIMKAYFQFQQGDISSAHHTFEQASKSNSFYYLVIKGIIYDDINSLWLSLLKCLSEKRTFLANLPVKLLLKKDVPIEDLKESLGIDVEILL